MIPSDRRRIIAENLEVLAGCVGDLQVAPGWTGAFETMLSRVIKFNRSTGKNFQLLR